MTRSESQNAIRIDTIRCLKVRLVKTQDGM